MILTDTHTHLYSDQFEADLEAVIYRAKQVGVTRFFVPAIDSSYTEKMLQLEQKFPEEAIFLMMGLHPTSVKDHYQDELHHVKEMLTKRNFVAIGEIGIDLYWDKSFIKQQQEVFQTQIQWAKKLDLPIVIHCREAFDEVFEVLEQEKDPKLKGIFHCFTGTQKQAERALDFNMKLGIGGVVTFKNGKIDQFLKSIPLDYIVLETDAPYLAPVPYRGKRNESAYLALVAEKLATIYQTDIESIAKITTQNSKDIFKI